jgi:2-isopropylmalate synthase
VLAYKGETFGVTTSASTEALYDAFEVLCHAIGTCAPRNKAIFGLNAFATQAGIHQAGMLRAPITYESIEPARFGRERRMLVGRHSGRAVLRFLFEDMDMPVDDQVIDDLYGEYIANRTNGECVEMHCLRDMITSRLGAGQRELALH